MDTQNTSRQLRYLEEVRIPLHRAGFGTLPLEGAQLPVLRYSADDVRCKDCTRYDSGHPCHLNECIWLIAEHTLPLHF